MYKKKINFKGINFYNVSYDEILSKINQGGYLVAPAASALSKILSNPKYYNSLKKADVAILDSGFFCILLRLFKRYKVNKLSGYLFLKRFLNMKHDINEKFLSVDPGKTDAEFNLNFYKKKKIYNVKSYIAPNYNNVIEDKSLLKLIIDFKPRYILINLGGETQEILALYIKEKVDYKVSILCTGAAIAFLTKRQAPINDIIDKYYLGWLIRILYNPKKYFVRIISSLKLIKLFL